MKARHRMFLGKSPDGKKDSTHLDAPLRNPADGAGKRFGATPAGALLMLCILALLIFPPFVSLSSAAGLEGGGTNRTIRTQESPRTAAGSDVSPVKQPAKRRSCRAPSVIPAPGAGTPTARKAPAASPDQAEQTRTLRSTAGGNSGGHTLPQTSTGQ